MFDVSFGELMLIGAVTLIVVGPERMPKIARTAGMLFGRLQRFIGNVKAELQQEMHMSELAQLEAQLRQEADQIQQTIEQPLSDAASILAAGAAPAATSTANPQANAADQHSATSPNQHGQQFAKTLPPLDSAYRDRR